MSRKKLPNEQRTDPALKRFRNAAVAARGFQIIEKEPVNLEMPFGTLDRFLTPNENFYVRCHFPIPQIDAKKWRLTIEGEVKKPRTFRLADLRALPAQSTTSLLECAGNNRVFLMPKVKGAQWQLGAVGNATWTGVRLADLLAAAGVKKGALEVVLEGADEGEIKEPPRPAGKIRYARSVPLEKALDDVLLAYEMNGRPLSDTHGAPLRAIVPGWYGMAAVKWLCRVIVTKDPFQGFYQTIEYTIWERRHKILPVQVQLGEVPVKAQISRPEVGEVVPANAKIWVQGAAWTADSEVTKVEVSDDRGASWKKARLLGKPVRNAWQLWEFPWTTPKKAGKKILMARATDALGRVQPLERDPDRGTYNIDHSLPIEVEVR